MDAEAKAQREVEKAEAEAEKARKEKADRGLKTNIVSPFETEPHIHPDDETALHHELGHHFQIAKAGHPTHDIIGRLHPDIDKGALAEARWHPDAFIGENGKIDLNYLKDNIGSLLDIFHGGPVADEIMNDVPVHKNAGARSDLRRARTKLIEAGFSPSEAGQLMAASEARVRKDFTTPGVRDIFQRFSQAREAGLDPGLLMSPETSGRAIQEFKDILEGTNETNNEPTPAGKGGRGNKQGKSRGVGEVSSGRAEGARIAAAPREGAGGELRTEIGKGVKPFNVEWKPNGKYGVVNPKGVTLQEFPTREAAEAAAYKMAEQSQRVKAEQEELKTEINEGKPKIMEIIPELKDHPEIEQRIKDLGFEDVLQKAWHQQHRTAPKAEPVEAKTKPGMPAERTTGSPERDAAIKEGGGIPAGVMKGDESINLPELTLFHDPRSGSTLALPTGKVTVEAVRDHIRESRNQYAAAEDEASKHHEGEQ